MSEQLLKAGDVVRLKSGGPKMTVDESVSMGRVGCSWWDEKRQAFTGRYFEVESLTIPTPEAEGTLSVKHPPTWPRRLGKVMKRLLEAIGIYRAGEYTWDKLWELGSELSGFFTISNGRGCSASSKSLLSKP